MNANNERSDQDRAHKHHHSNVKAGVECLIAEGGTQQARTGADSAHPEIESFDPAARNGKQPQQNGRDNNEDGAQHPGAGGHGRGQPDPGGWRGFDHLPEGNQQERDRVDQRHQRPLPVGQDGEFAHTKGYFSERVNLGM